MSALRVYFFTVLFIGAPRIFSQTLLYSEDFNTSLNTCTATNSSFGSWIWTNSCAFSSYTGHTASGSAFFQGTACKFGNSLQTTSGNLVTPPIAIGSSGAILNFNYIRVGEVVGAWDVLSVQVSNNNGASFTTLLHTNFNGGLIGYSGLTSTTNVVWNQACCNLSAYTNQVVIVRFNFNTIDGILNDYDGIYVDDISVFVPAPLTVWQSTNNVCPGTAVTLSTNAVSGFSWSTGSTSPVIVVMPTVTTTYFVNGCAGSSGGSGTLVVNVTPTLNLSIGTSSPGTVFCTNAPVNLIATAIGGIPGYTYNWQGTTPGSSYPAGQPAPGSYIYTVTVTDAHTCNLTQTTSLTFIQSPSLSAIPGQTVCSGTSATLSTSGAHTYTWYPNGTISHSTIVTPTVQSTYTVIGTNTLTGCTTTGTTTVYFKPTPTLAVIQASITCASLGFGTVTATGGIGPFSYHWAPTNQTTAIASNLNTSIYTISVVDAGTGCTTTTTTQYTPLTPLTGQLVNDTILLCNNIPTGSAHFINLANGSGNEVYVWTNGISTFTSSHPVNLDIGTWSVTVSDALTACQVFSVFTITEPPPLVLNLSANTPSICIGGQITLTSTLTGGTPGYTYLWTGGSTSSSRTVLEISPGPYSYTLTVTDSNSCTVTNTIGLNFIPNPVLSVTDVSICPLAIGTLTVSGASTYTWNNTVTGSVFTDSPLTNTEYTVVGSALGCTTAASASIILFPSPVPIMTMPTSICESSVLSMNASGGTSFLWTGPSFFNSTVASPVINPVTLGHNGVYNLTVTSVNGCTASTSSTLTVNPTPGLSATGATVCTSQTLQLTANSIPGATFKWTGPQNFNTTTQNPVLVHPAVSRTGNYTVVATSAFGCTNTTNADVLVGPPPSLTASLSTYSLCSQAFNGSKNTITLTAAGANIYTITTSPDMSISNPGGPVSNLTAVPPNTGVGTSTVYGSNGVCTVTRVLTFSIIPNPSVTVASTPVICAGESYTYTSQGASSYTWSNSTPGFTTYNNGGVAVAHPSINSVFSVFGGSLGCYSASKTSTITINPLPTVTLIPTQPTVCLYKSTQLTASGTATAYTWPTAPGLINGSGTSVIVTPLSLQLYTVTGQLNNCFASATAAVNVKALPQPTITAAKDAYCENENITLSGEGGLIYEWRGPNNLYYNKKEISSGSASTWAGGAYSLTVTDGIGCQNTATKLITIHNAPQGSLLGYKESGCLPLCTTYDFKGKGTGVSGSWTINDQTFGDQFKYCFSSPGTFTISGLINDKATGCDNHLNFKVTVYPKPEADFSYSPLHPIENLDEVKFKNTTIDQNQTAWNWYFVNNNGYQSSEENLRYLFSEPGEYPIAFVVTNNNNCADTVMKVVKVEPDFTLYIPDAFTPNGDDLNDVFLPIVRSSKLYTLSVFDRWGKRIFYSTSPQSGWDGTFMGSECKMDVYSYKIILSTVSGEKKEYGGHVSLVR